MKEAEKREKGKQKRIYLVKLMREREAPFLNSLAPPSSKGMVISTPRKRKQKRKLGKVSGAILVLRYQHFHLYTAFSLFFTVFLDA